MKEKDTDAKDAKKDAKVLVKMTTGTLEHIKKHFGGEILDEEGYICPPVTHATINQKPGQRELGYASEAQGRTVPRPRESSPVLSEPDPGTAKLLHDMKGVVIDRLVRSSTMKKLSSRGALEEDLKPVTIANLISFNPQDQVGQTTSGSQQSQLAFDNSNGRDDDEENLWQPKRQLYNIDNEDLLKMGRQKTYSGMIQTCQITKGSCETI